MSIPSKNKLKGSQNFIKAIQSHLDSLAKEDPLFKETLQKPNKNIDDCVTYILNTVKNSGCNGFEPDEIYNMAVHYYDEDQIEIGKPLIAQVIVNHAVKLTPEEEEEIREKARKEVFDNAKQNLTTKKSKQTKSINNNPTLF